MWTFVNNFNISKLYTIRKYFSSRGWIQDRYLKIRLLLARIHLQSFYFCTEMRANDPSTFTENRGYHLKEGVEMNLLGPRTNSESGRRMAFERCYAEAPSRAAHYSL